MHSNRRSLVVYLLISALLVVYPLYAAEAVSDICAQQTDGQSESASDASDAGIAHARGLLWRIEKPGLMPSHLFGTIHLEDARVTDLPEQVEQVLLNSSSFGMEVVLDSEANAVYMSMAVQGADTSLREQIGEVLFRHTAEIMQTDYGYDGTQLDRLKPWVVFTILGRPRPVTGKVLDSVLRDLSIRQGIPVFGLETVEELVEVLDTLPLEQQTLILRDTVCQHDLLAGQVEKLTERYLDRDLAGMLSLNDNTNSQQDVFERFMNRILYKRNHRMAERMQGMLQQGGSFIAVGALHLPGEEGILRLLELQGYSVTQVY